MAVLKEVLSKYGKDLDVWLSVDERNMLLSVLRDSFLDCDEFELKKEILSMIELLAGSFQLRDDAGWEQVHFSQCLCKELLNDPLVMELVSLRVLDCAAEVAVCSRWLERYHQPSCVDLAVS